MNENIVKIEAKGFQDLCNHFRDLEEKNKFLENENTQLKADNSVLGNELTYFKEYCADLEDEVNKKTRMLRSVKNNNRDLTIERNELIATLQDMKNTRKYLTAEEAGREFARELLGVGQ